jgi:hypothetical protein
MPKRKKRKEKTHQLVPEAHQLAHHAALTLPPHSLNTSANHHTDNRAATQARHCPHAAALPCAPPAGAHRRCPLRFPPPQRPLLPPPWDIYSVLCRRRSDPEPPPPNGGRSGRLQARSQAAATGLPPPHHHRPSFQVFILTTVALRRISRRGDTLTSRCALPLKRRLKNYGAHHACL